MRRALSLLLCAALLTGCLSGCGPGMEAASDAPSVVVSIYPIYDWVLRLLGDRADAWNVILLCDQATDMHSFQPSVQDLVDISTADLFLYVGGESDAWVEDALSEAVNPAMVSLPLLDALGDRALLEETVEGMKAEAEEDEEVPDEHIWLSLRNAAALSGPISGALSALDPDHTDSYERARRDFTAELEALDGRYQAAIQAAPVRTLLFADRFPFRYLVEDYREYGLSYYAAFAGCEAETGASFETVAFLSDKLAELRLPAVCVLEQPADGGRLAETIIDTAGVEAAAVTLDSMQNYSPIYGQQGGYLGVMERNLAGLTEALGGNLEDT